MLLPLPLIRHHYGHTTDADSSPLELESAIILPIHSPDRPGFTTLLRLNAASAGVRACARQLALSKQHAEVISRHLDCFG